MALRLDDVSYDHQQAIQVMLPQLLIVLVSRLGGDITVPATEIDDTGKFVLMMDLNQEKREFHFVVKKKADL